MDHDSFARWMPWVTEVAQSWVSRSVVHEAMLRLLLVRRSVVHEAMLRLLLLVGDIVTRRVGAKGVAKDE